MDFRLTYRGSLPTDATPLQKHSIRKQFHPQLKELWTQIPLLEHRDYLNPSNKEITVIKEVGGFQFAVLVCEVLKVHAEIDIVLLRPGPLGGLLIRGGDIDNRLKTLFDALRYPRELQELPKGFTPSDDEKPFFCLLEDDKLITKVSVAVDRLLVPSEPNEVQLTIQVKVKITQVIFGNMALMT